MDKVTFIETETMGQTTQHAIVEHPDGSFTSMTKKHYEAQQVEHLTDVVK
jgi:hypothetical protein